LSVQPPEAGSGITVPLLPWPASATVALPTDVTTPSEPVAAPATAGENFTDTAKDDPAARVAPAAGNPVAVNGTAGLLIELMVKALPPVFESVTVCAALLPSWTFPNDKLAGVTESTAGEGARPVPESATAPVPTELTTLSVALEATALLGAKVTVAATDWPADSVVPTAGRPAAENGAAKLPIELMVSALPPVFAIVTVCVALLPTSTFPNGCEAGVTDSTPGCAAAAPSTIETLATAC